MKTKWIVANEFFDHHEYMEHPTDLAELCWSQQENHEFVNSWNESMWSQCLSGRKLGTTLC